MRAWDLFLEAEYKKPYFTSLQFFLAARRTEGVIIYPSEKELFASFELTPFEKIKVVILGQDPYHGQGQAHGLCFSVRDGHKTPPSLRNIFKELHSDLCLPIPTNGNLTKWAQNGVSCSILFLLWSRKVLEHINKKGGRRLPMRLFNISQDIRKKSFLYSGVYLLNKKIKHGPHYFDNIDERQKQRDFATQVEAENI